MIFSDAELDGVLRLIPYEFKDGSYIKSDQHKRYRAALDEIQALAVKMQRERNK